MTLTGFALYNQGLTTGDLIMNIPTFSGYTGSIIMAIFAFTMQPMIAIVGLILLTVQAVDAKMYNLVALNLISIGGFLTNYMGAL